MGGCNMFEHFDSEDDDGNDGDGGKQLMQSLNLYLHFGKELCLQDISHVDICLLNWSFQPLLSLTAPL